MHAKVCQNFPSLTVWLLVILCLLISILLETGETPQEGEEKQAAKGALNKEKNAKLQHFTSFFRHL
jgi:hypothetical protein